MAQQPSTILSLVRQKNNPSSAEQRSYQLFVNPQFSDVCIVTNDGDSNIQRSFHKHRIFLVDVPFFQSAFESGQQMKEGQVQNNDTRITI